MSRQVCVTSRRCVGHPLPPLTDYRHAIRGATLLAIGLLLTAGCARQPSLPSQPQNTAGAQMIEPPSSVASGPYRLQPGDVIDIDAPRRNELDLVTTVGPQGYITFPYLGALKVSGRTAAEVAEELDQQLVKGGWYARPDIHVSLQQVADQYVYVLGEVKQPGPIAINGSVDLLAALGRAGGETYDAQLSSVLWVRTADSPAGVVSLDLAALQRRDGPIQLPEFDMLAGDVLYVPDKPIASVQRFSRRLFDVIRTVVELERGLVLYPEVARFLEGNTGSGQPIITIAD